MKDTTCKQTEDFEHLKSIELPFKTVMQFIGFTDDKNLYDFIRNQLYKFSGKDSYIIVNFTNKESKKTIYSHDYFFIAEQLRSQNQNKKT